MEDRDLGVRQSVEFVQDATSPMDELVGEDLAISQNEIAESLFKSSSYVSYGSGNRHKAEALIPKGQESSAAPTVG